MTRATLILRTQADRDKCERWVKGVPAGTSVEFKAPRRSPDQNRLLWALLTDLAQQVCWHGQYLSAEDWKDMTSASLRKSRVVPGIEPGGNFVVLGMRTSDMTKAEFSALIELIRAFGAEHGVKFSDEEKVA